MKFTTSLVALLLSSPALAVPVSVAADVAEWTIVGLVRTLSANDTTATWKFSVDTGAPDVTAVSYVVNATATAPASQSNGGPTVFGNFTVTSGWSGQFGPGNGFTTLSVIDYAAKLIAYPAYTDSELAAGTVVTPDRSYPVQSLP